jgi:hypothetical protein
VISNSHLSQPLLGDGHNVLVLAREPLEEHPDDPGPQLRVLRVLQVRPRHGRAQQLDAGGAQLGQRGRRFGVQELAMHGLQRQLRKKIKEKLLDVLEAEVERSAPSWRLSFVVLEL